MMLSTLPARATSRSASRSPSLASASTALPSAAAGQESAERAVRRDLAGQDLLLRPSADPDAEAAGILDADDMIECHHFGDAAVRAAQQVAVHDGAGAEELAAEHGDEIAQAGRGTDRALGDRRERSVVLHADQRSPRAEQLGEVRIHAAPEPVAMRG